VKDQKDREVLDYAPSLGRGVRWRKGITITIVAVATIAAVLPFRHWALRPLGVASYLSSSSETGDQIITRYWPHRLVQPQWISTTPGGADRFTKWHFYETAARVSVVGAFWLTITGGAIWRLRISRKNAKGTKPGFLNRGAR